MFIQQEEARKFAADLVKRPTEYLDVIKWYAKFTLYQLETPTG